MPGTLWNPFIPYHSPLTPLTCEDEHADARVIGLHVQVIQQVSGSHEVVNPGLLNSKACMFSRSLSPSCCDTIWTEGKSPHLCVRRPRPSSWHLSVVALDKSWQQAGLDFRSYTKEDWTHLSLGYPWGLCMQVHWHHMVGAIWNVQLLAVTPWNERYDNT